MIRRRILAAAAAAALAVPTAADALTARNVLLFVADGASWGAWDMASYWEYGETGRQVYDGFETRMGMTTEFWSDPQRVYDPDAAWDDTPTGDGDFFAGYKRIKQAYTDSAAAGTALATGRKTLRGRINVGPAGEALPHAGERMKAAGKAVGVVSSVPFSHATPAAFAARQVNRGAYLDIANQMIHGGTADVIMGGGNPLYDAHGRARSTPLFNRISEADWNALNGPGAPMTLVQTKAGFEALADGTLDIPGRVIGLPQVGDTLQYRRGRSVVGFDPSTPSGRAYIDSVPTLETMTRGALNLLGDDPDGMFLMVEGGAVDWAAHANDTAGLIEEMIDFNAAARAAAEWVERESSWDETLMIVLTDHGNGMPMGPNSNSVAFQPIRNNGAGVLPGVRWHYGVHTTENTLLWAQGAGSELFAEAVAGNDPYLASILGFNDGSYIDNTAVHGVMLEAVAPEASAPVPLPGGVWLLGAAGLALFGLRARRPAA